MPPEWVAIAVAVVMPLLVGLVSYGMLQGKVSAVAADVARLEATKASRETLEILSERLGLIEGKLLDATDTLHRIEGMLQGSNVRSRPV